MEKEDGTLEVLATSINITNATIPEKINGKTVTAIRQAGFWGCPSLKSVEMPNTITKVGYEAFGECTSLTSVKLSNSLNEIDSYTFYKCTSLKNITIPNSVKKIGWCSFEASGITTINLTAVEEISSWAFGNCTSLKTIYMPKTIKYIYDNPDGDAFGNIPASQLTIYGYSGTVAESYAKKSGYKFIDRSFQFNDIDSKAWYYNSVKYVAQNGMIYGTSDTKFNPNGTLTRGMLVTILWRMEGEQKVATGGFSDVKAGQYYYDAVKWAVSKKIVSGYNDGKFKPNTNITREQLATILKNYAGYKRKDVTSRTDLSKFKDNKGISGFAKDSISWAVAKKVISGKENGTKVDPRGTATRAEASAMLTNYCNNVGR